MIIKPYEISLWKDVIKYVGTNGIEYDSISEMGGIPVDYQYYTEQRIVTLGSDKMLSSPARALNPIYTRNINGTETLTFDMNYQYEEIETGELVHNPIIDYVVNERKVKLFYEDKWHDFIVKKNNEKGRENKYSYTCTGLPANELGKTGYNVELDIELENNMGTVQELGEEVLRGSDWQLSQTDQEIIDQTNDEALYKTITNTALTATIRGTETTIEVPVNSIIYIYYTSFATQEVNYFQFIYVTGNGTPDLLEDKITINCNNTRTFDLFLNNIEWSNEFPKFCYKAITVTEQVFNQNKKLYYYLDDGEYIQCDDESVYSSSIQYYIKQYGVADYRGRRYVRKQLSAYDPTLKRAVLKYTKQGQGNKEYYGYTTTDYVDATFVQNCIYNSTNFKGTSYWTLTGNSTTKTLDAVVVPRIDVDNAEQERAGYLLVNFGNSTNTKLVNDGIIQNYSRINRFEKGEVYRFSVYIGTVSNDTFSPIDTLPFNIKIKKYLLIDQEPQDDVIYFDSTGITPVVKSNGYIVIDLPCLVSATWDDLKELVGIFIVPTAADSTNYYIKDIQLYKRVEGPSYALVEITESEFNANKTSYYYYDGTDYIQCTNQSIYDSDTKYYVQHDIVEPGDVPEMRIETTYHFYDPDENIGKLSEDDYIFSDADPSLYTPLFGSGDHEFEKIRSITAKESNRFNLLQELAETFECWVKFQIAHEPNGQVSIETFDYYNLLNLAEGADVTNYYIYDWHNKSYITPEEQTALAGQKYYDKVIRKRQVKRVAFYKEILIDNYVGFKYGINLKDNNRTLDSEQIVTKIIVKNNSCEQAENGFCTISRAKDNPIKENFAYNFDYYTSQGIIDLSTLNNDLYLELNGSIGLYPKLSRLNKERNDIINSAALIANSINNLSSEYQVAKLTYDSAFKELDRILDPQNGTIFKYTHYIYDDFYNQVWRKTTENSEPGVEVPSYANEIYIINQNSLNYIYTASDDLTFYKETEDTTPSDNKTYYFISSGKFVALENNKFAEGVNYYEQIDVTKTPENNKYKYDVSSLEDEPIYFQTGEEANPLTFVQSSANTAQVYIYNAARRRISNLGAEDFINDNFTIATLQKVVTLQEELRLAEQDIVILGPQLEDAQAEYDSYQDKLRTIANATTEIEKEFIVKYSRYIQEGSWTDDNYMDDDLYYFDALAVLYQSAYPKITYNFSVLDLSELEGYEAYKFDIGHKTYVEDTEFFGYKYINGLRTPAREQVVVTEATKNLDENDKNQLKIQNYKSHFEDLFQRITAATQNLEFHSGEYEKAAEAITPTGEISSTTLQRSFANSAYIISNSHDQSVVWDDTGIQATNLSDPAQVTRLASAGLLISSDGGRSWNVAISGYGINTNYLSAGVIDADNINIMCGAWPTFRWDSLGLRAYAYEADDTGAYINYDASKYVVFDRFGLYGINGLTSTEGIRTVEDVESNANYALTWNGLFIRSKHRDGYTSISPYNDITLVDTSGNSEVVRAQLAQLTYDPITGEALNNSIFGLVLRDQSGNPTVTTQDDGTLWLHDSMRIGDNSDQNGRPRIYLGRGEDIIGQQNLWKVMRIYNTTDQDDRFVLYSDGTMRASGVNIEGHIDATSGTIGGLSIDELVKSTGVRIIAKSGDTFKVDIQNNVTPSQLVFSCNSNIEEDTSSRFWDISNDLVSWTRLGTTLINTNFILSYDSASNYFDSGVCYLRLQVIANGKTYSDILTLKLDTIDDKYRIDITEETILKFPISYSYDDNIYNWSLSLNELEIKVIDLNTNVYISPSVNNQLTIEVQEGTLLEYLQTYDPSLTNLNRYLSINNDNTGWVLNLGLLLEDFPNATLWNTTDIQFIRFLISLTNEGNTFNLNKNIFIQVGTTDEMAKLAINANGINMAIANAKLRFSQTGLTIENGGLEILATNNGETYRALTFDETTGNLIIIGDIYADNGEFNGIIHARDGEFNGKITSTTGEIGGFIINDHSIISQDGSLELYSSYTDSGNLVESRINVKNINIGTGARIAQYLQIGNLRLLNPETTESHQNVLELKDSGINYFTLTNKGEVIGNNWHIAKNGNGEVEAEFDLLRVNNGYFKGTVNATDGNFTGAIDASIINATTINAVDFNSERIRSMGGAFIFRPNIPIEQSLTTSDTSHIYVTVTNSEYYQYFGYNNHTNKYDGAIGEIVLLAGENIDASSITNGVTSRYGKITKIETQIAGNEYYLIITIDVGDNQIPIPQSAFEYYKSLILFGKPTIEDVEGDVVIGINSDNNPATKFLPKHSLTMAHFGDLIGDAFSQTYVVPQIKLLLGELDTLGKTYVNGYGLYAENVYLTGSLITEYNYNKENLSENNSTYAGINTTDDGIRLRKDSEASYGRSYFNPNGVLERPVFWGGARGLSEEAINQAPLILTDQGNIYAMSGVFAGAIISNSVISETVLKAPVIYGSNNKDGVSLKLINTTEFGQSGNFGGIGFYELVGDIDFYGNKISSDEYIYGVDYPIVETIIIDKVTNEAVEADVQLLDEKSIKVTLNQEYEHTLSITITSFDETTGTLYTNEFETNNSESNDLLTLLITSNGFYHYYNSNAIESSPKSFKFIDFSRGSKLVSFNGNKLMLENTIFTDNKISRAGSSILLDNGSKMILSYSNNSSVEISAEGVHCTGSVQTLDKQVVFADGVRMNYRKTGNYYCLYVEDA